MYEERSGRRARERERTTIPGSAWYTAGGKEAKIKKMEVQRLGKCRKAELDAVPSDDEQSISARLTIA